MLKILADVDALSEEDNQVPQWLMMEVFELRSELEQVNSEEDLMPLH